MNFKDKHYYIERAKFYLGLAVSAFAFDAFLFVLFISWAHS